MATAYCISALVVSSLNCDKRICTAESSSKVARLPLKCTMQSVRREGCCGPIVGSEEEDG